MKRRDLLLLTLRQLVAWVGVFVSMTFVLGPLLLHDGGDPDRRRYVSTMCQMEIIMDACRRYQAARGDYPSDSEGLAALSPYLAGLPRRIIEVDPWGGELIYLRAAPGSEPEIRSLGADRNPGGKYFDADISSRELVLSVTRTPREVRRSWVLRVVWAESCVALAGFIAWLRELCRSGQGWLVVKSTPVAYHPVRRGP